MGLVNTLKEIAFMRVITRMTNEMVKVNMYLKVGISMMEIGPIVR